MLQVDIPIELAQTKIHTDIRKYKFKDMLQVDTAMTAVSAGPGKSASQIFFYDWSDNYRRVIKVEINLLMTIILLQMTIIRMTIIPMMQEMKAREAAAKKEGKWTIFMFKLLKILFSFKNHKIKKKKQY